MLGISLDFNCFGYQSLEETMIFQAQRLRFKSRYHVALSFDPTNLKQKILLQHKNVYMYIQPLVLLHNVP